MKKNLKNEKGITLITLMITIVIMAILVGFAVSNLDTGTDIRNYNYMCADIELLEAKIMTHYNENGSIPTTGNAIDITSITTLVDQVSSHDNDKYYQIDISKLYNITLNYGRGTESDDIYIINEQSHEVYYLKGAYYEDTLYHTEM